ncbi:phosphoglycolate phosphatase [Sanguibacter gelidistatuariae]|uniref:Tyrosine-protein kinase PtkA n=1 Tax=Sanguibacter gelidistatuariae TaxID=1814289 RepID=A0A1G6HAV6_9MICO|nr:HAD hydrolase-like protein [Sanguibacter gelidistatuariae]SDB91341.1 phosphoglycolate phosphatase [Sanguibacter gelidistatuariae]
MAYSLALVDLDGTLTDSAPGIIASITYAFDTLGLPRPSEEDLRRVVGPPIEESALRHGVPGERLTEFVTAYRAAFTGGGMLNNSVYPGIREALTTLLDGGIRLVVATSKPEVFARQILEHFDLDQFFEAICGSTLDGTRSTKADVIEHALKTVAATEGGLPQVSDIVMVGDREHDILGARTHGIETIAVTWGYAAAGEHAAARPRAVASTPDELAAAVLAP